MTINYNIKIGIFRHLVLIYQNIKMIKIYIGYIKIEKLFK